jgi:hypothetical protein
MTQTRIRIPEREIHASHRVCGEVDRSGPALTTKLRSQGMLVCSKLNTFLVAKTGEGREEKRALSRVVEHSCIKISGSGSVWTARYHISSEFND